MTPALLINVSSRPSSATVRSTAPWAWSWSVMSASITSAVPPCSRDLAGHLLEPVGPSGHESDGRTLGREVSAQASPMPLEAPVTRATVSVRRGAFGWGSVCGELIGRVCRVRGTITP